MIGLVWGAFRLLPGLAQLGIVAGIALSLAGTWYGFKTHYYNQGWYAGVAALAAKDKVAIDAADKITLTIDGCFNAGREWDAIGGMCK